MKNAFLLLLSFTLLFSSCQTANKTVSTAAATTPKDTRFFELRTYYAHPGKLADLQNRFRTNTTRIFEKHGMTNIGYWEPIDNTENKLVYLLAYPSKEARDASWKAFGTDPEWKQVAQASEANGKLVARVETMYLETTDYSPALPTKKSSDPRVFEIRTYNASPGNIENLHARFRNHTVKLFEKHGMTNIAYWRPVDKDKEKPVLFYILAHKDQAAGEASFKSFRADPDWLKAKEASEKAGGGSLTTTVKSEYMRATDYSAIK